jgi:hypothetical protein
MTERKKSSPSPKISTDGEEQAARLRVRRINDEESDVRNSSVREGKNNVMNTVGSRHIHG